MGPSRRSGNARKGGGYGQAIMLILSDEPDRRRSDTPYRPRGISGKRRSVTRSSGVGSAKSSPVIAAAVEAAKAAVRIALKAPLTSGFASENEMNTLCLAAGDHVEGARALWRNGSSDFGSVRP